MRRAKIVDIERGRKREREAGKQKREEIYVKQENENPTKTGG